MPAIIAIALVVLAGCGRLSYDPLGELATDADVPPVTGLCEPTVAFDFSLGYQHACAVQDGALYCWGFNDTGQLGLGDAAIGTDAQSPLRVGGDTDWAMVRAGLRHTCALRCSGQLWCWGQNDQGQLAVSDTASTAIYAEPTIAISPQRFVDLWVGRNHSCALAANRTLWCWGSNGSRQLGLGNNTDAPLPTQVQINAPQVGADDDWDQAGPGDDHTCAVKTDGSLWCWGSNGNGQLGQAGAPVVREFPSRVGTENVWSEARGGLDSSLATRTDGSVHSWGRNEFGQLALGDTADRDFPAPIASSSQWVQASLGYEHGCAITSGRTLECWGLNMDGALGQGPGGLGTSTDTPTQVGALADWEAVFCGDQSTCAIRQSELYCWGQGTHGRLGLGNADDQADVAGPLVIGP